MKSEYKKLFTRAKLYLYRSDYLFDVVFLLMLLLQQYLLIVTVRDNIITVATHAIIFGKKLMSNKILVTYTLVLTIRGLYLSINEEFLAISFY